MWKSTTERILTMKTERNMISLLTMKMRQMTTMNLRIRMIEQIPNNQAMMIRRVNMKMRIWILCTEIMKFSPSFTRNILLICEFWMRLVSRPSTRPRASPMELSGSTRELTTCCCRGNSSDRRSMDATEDTSLVIELVTPCFVKNMPGRGSSLNVKSLIIGWKLLIILQRRRLMFVIHTALAQQIRNVETRTG